MAENLFADLFPYSAADVPVLICRGDAVLRNPSYPRRSPTAWGSTMRSISDPRPRLAGSSAQVRRGSPLPSTARLKGWTCSSSNRNLSRRASWFELCCNPKLPGISNRHFRSGAYGDAPNHKCKSWRGRYWWRKARRSWCAPPSPIRGAPGGRRRAHRCPCADHRVVGAQDPQTGDTQTFRSSKGRASTTPRPRAWSPAVHC